MSSGSIVRCAKVVCHTWRRWWSRRGLLSGSCDVKAVRRERRWTGVTACITSELQSAAVPNQCNYLLHPSRPAAASGRSLHACCANSVVPERVVLQCRSWTSTSGPVWIGHYQVLVIMLQRDMRSTSRRRWGCCWGGLLGTPRRRRCCRWRLFCSPGRWWRGSRGALLCSCIEQALSTAATRSTLGAVQPAAGLTGRRCSWSRSSYTGGYGLARHWCRPRDCHGQSSSPTGSVNNSKTRPGPGVLMTSSMQTGLSM